MNYSNYTSCPRGFIIPEHPEAEGIRWVPATNCAYSCARSPFATKAYYDDLYSYDSMMLSIILLIVSLANFIFLGLEGEKWKMNYLFLVFIVATVPISIMNVVSHVLNHHKDGAAFCVDNAVPYTSKGKTTLLPCLLQSVFNVYFLMCAMAAFVAIAIDIVFVIVYEKKSMHLKWVYMGLIAFTPILSIIGMFRMNSFGYSSPSGTCHYVILNPFAWITLPSILLLIPCCCILWTWYTIVVRVYHKRKSLSWLHSLLDLTNMLSPPLLFSTLTLCAYCNFLYFRLYYFRAGNETDRLMPAHVQCIFDHYDGVNDESWLPHCGEGIHIMNAALQKKWGANVLLYTQSMFFVVSLIPTYLKRVYIRLKFRMFVKRLSSAHISSLTDHTALASDEYVWWRLMGWCLYCVNCCRSRDEIAPVVVHEEELSDHMVELMQMFDNESLDELGNMMMSEIEQFPVRRPVLLKPGYICSSTHDAEPSTIVIVDNADAARLAVPLQLIES